MHNSNYFVKYLPLLLVWVVYRFDWFKDEIIRTMTGTTNTTTVQKNYTAEGVRVCVSIPLQV